MKRLYLIGIGGSGMMPLARLARSFGYEVEGSDPHIAPSREESLRQKGITVHRRHDPGQIPAGAAVVYSSAIPPENPERKEAERLRDQGVCTLLHRMDLLNLLVEKYPFRVAVGGTHGKTSTASLLGWIFQELGLDPLVIVGGHPLYLEEGVRAGKGAVAVYETDESDGSFLKARPTHRLILNVDADHLDHYGGFEALQEAFAQFALAPGVSVLNGNDSTLGAISLPPERILQTILFRVEEGQAGPERGEGGETTEGAGAKQKTAFSSHGVEVCRGSFEGESDRLRLAEGGEIRLPVPGRHFAHNALGALALAERLLTRGRTGEQLELLGAGREEILRIMNRFPGVERRIEPLGEWKGALLYADYGHHPTEIRAVIGALRRRMDGSEESSLFEGRGGRLIVLFQPHRYTRTRNSAPEFARALEEADRVVLMPLYSAGESPLPGVGSHSIRDCMKKPEETLLLEEESLDPVLDSLEPGDVLLSMGAGDISRKMRETLLRRRKTAES